MDTPEITDNRHRVLDWAPKHDKRSRAFAARPALRGSTRLRNKDWATGPTLDQLAEGACVGFGWTADALALPIRVDLTRVARLSDILPSAVLDVMTGADPTTKGNAFARALYRRAQILDEWRGEDYDGTSVNGGAKAMRELGLVGEYRWCFGIADVRDTILTSGPVVIGINWYDDMYDAPGGILTVGGYLVGGHCLTVTGYRVAGTVFEDEPAYRVRNSWGNSWGIGGSAFIRESELSALLKQDGEAAVAVRRSYGRTK